MNGDLPLVSIVIPAYNHAGFLDEAIRSVLQQDYPHIELIVLDDGSTDRTAEVLKSYGNRFYWETQKNMGQANTLNKGWRMSRGAILSYISADDVLLPQAARRAVECLHDNPDTVLAYCDFNLVTPDSKVMRRVRAPDFDYGEMLAKIKCPPGPGTFFTRSAFEKAGLWDPGLRAMLDYDYWLRLGLHGRFVRIPEVLALYRVHHHSQTFSGYSETQAAEPVLIVSRFFDNAPLPPALLALRKQALSNAHLVCAQLNYRAGRYRIGNASLREAYLLCPGNYFTIGFIRLVLNVLFSRLTHRLLWKIRRVLPV